MVIATVAGVVLGAIYTLSPMTVWFVVLGVALLRIATRGLPPREARWVVAVLGGAMAMRAVMVAALFLFGTPDTSLVPFNVFFGDEGYLIVRALRQRALWLGRSMTFDSYFLLFDTYGRTSYLTVLALAQYIVGPSPYGVHLLGVLLYASGGVVLHRFVRRAYGPVPALGGLAFLLFLPSLVLWSTSALKESLNFLLVITMLACTALAMRARWRWRLFAALGALGCLAWLATLRDGALEIGAAGLSAGVFLALITRTWKTFAFAVIVLAIVAGPAWRRPRVEATAMDIVRLAAMKHRGHVYTRGHSYELLDNAFYGRRSIQDMDHEDAARFVGRGIVSVILYPTPWQMRSMSELAYLPEQMIWYVIVLLVPIGFAVGLARDRVATCLLAGYAFTALVAVGVNSGNMGTLVRHRAFALPYLGVLAVLGAAFLTTHLGRRETRQ